MRPTRARSPFHLRAICCLLSYTLVSTLLGLPGRGVEASPGAARGTSKAANSSPVRKAQADAPRREGELIVRFHNEVSEQGKDDVARSHGARRKGKLRGDSHLEKLELHPNQDPQAVAEQLRGKPEVELVEPNFIIKHEQVTPNDSRFAEQWALQNTGQSGGVSGSDVGATRAWQKITGSPSTVIAVVDSGINFTHPDLRGNEWSNDREKANGKDDDRDGYADDLHGWDWVADSGVIRDEHGHGTAVAGIIAAQGNNGVGTSGVMWRASLMSLRVLDSTGTGDIASAVEAIDYAVAHGASVINCSWGTGGESRAPTDAITPPRRKRRHCPRHRALLPCLLRPAEPDLCGLLRPVRQPRAVLRLGCQERLGGRAGRGRADDEDGGRLLAHLRHLRLGPARLRRRGPRQD